MLKIDKQFLFFLLTYISVGILDLIDTGFGNHLGIDAVCVFTSYSVITWTTKCFYNIGSYAYRTVMKYAKECLFMQVCVSILLGFIIYLTCPIIVRIYNLTDTQYELFERCLVVHAISLPVLAIMYFITEYLEYNCKNKQYAIGNFIYYTIMIVSDSLVLYYRCQLTVLLWCTFACTVVYDLFEIFASGILMEKWEFNMSTIIYLFSNGFDIVFDGITGKIATILYNAYASKLGTQLYSIHCICYSICVFTEDITECLYTYLIVKLHKVKYMYKKLNYCKKITKKYYSTLVIIGYILGYILLIFIHGDVPVVKCVLYTAIYCSDLFSHLLYTSMKAYLTYEQKTNYLKYGGVVGVSVRIPVVLIGYYTGIGLLTFALASAIDYLVRGIYYYLCSLNNNAKYMIIEQNM